MRRPHWLMAVSLPILFAGGFAAADAPPAGLLPTDLLAPRFAPFLLLPHPGHPPPEEQVVFFLEAGSGQVWKGDAGPYGSVGVSEQLVRFDAGLRFNTLDLFEAGLEIPVLWHARSFKKADDPVRVDIRYDGATLARAEGSACGISDARIWVAAFQRARKGPLRLVRGTLLLKTPSGRREEFEGTGRPDFGAALDATFALGSGFFAHGMIGFTLLGDPEGLQGGEVSVKTGVPFRLGFEWNAGGGIGVHLQVEGSNNVYPESGNERLDEHPIQVTGGGSWRVGDLVFHFAFSEDATRSAPDFSVSAGVAWFPQ